MPQHEEHCSHSFKRYGVRGEEIHTWIDEPSGIPTGTSHRNFRHDMRCLSVIKEVFKNKYAPEIIENILIDHIKLDMQSKEIRREKNIKRGGKKALCKWCNKEFHIDECHRVFCSQECHAEWTKKNATIPPVTKICKNCGKEFQTKRSSNKSLCSAQCHNEWFTKQKEKTIKKNLLTKRRILWKHRSHTHKCPICGKIFVPIKLHQKTCSNKCCDIERKSRLRKGVCKRCGKEFYYKGSIPPREYCSQKCWSLSVSENGKEEASFNFLSKTLATYIIKLRETDREAYLKCLKLAHEEFGDEWYTKFNRNISKFNIKTRGVGFWSNELRKGNGGRFAFDPEYGHTKKCMALAIPQTKILIDKTLNNYISSEEPNPLAVKILNILQNNSQHP